MCFGKDVESKELSKPTAAGGKSLRTLVGPAEGQEEGPRRRVMEEVDCASSSSPSTMFVFLFFRHVH
jgi:hypothetical protein